MHLAEILGVEKDEIIVFGDADNDREMFEQAGCSVAMANGLRRDESDGRLCDSV